MVRACPVAGQAAQCGHATVSNFSSAITFPANGARDESATPLSGTGSTHRRAAHRGSGAAWSSRASEITVEPTISSGGSHGCRWMTPVTLSGILRQSVRTRLVLPFMCGPRPVHHAFPQKRPPPSRPSCGPCTMAMTFVSGSCGQPWSTSPTPRSSSTCGSGFANDRSDRQALRNRRVARAGLAAPPCRGRPRGRHGALRAADPFGGRCGPTPQAHVPWTARRNWRTPLLAKRCTRGESISIPAVREFNGPRRESFSAPHTMEIFNAHEPLQRATVGLGCSFGTQKLQALQSPPRHIRVLHISGHFPAGHHRGDTVSVWCGCWCTAPKEI